MGEAHAFHEPEWVRSFVNDQDRPIMATPWLKPSKSLYYFQLAANNAMSDTHPNVILCLAMGIGKTLTTLGRFAAIIYGDGLVEECTFPIPRTGRKCELVCPPNLVDNWVTTVDKYFMPGTFNMVVVDHDRQRAIRSNGSQFRRQINAPVINGGATLVIVTDTWLKAMATDARKKLGARTLLSATKLSKRAKTEALDLFAATGKLDALDILDRNMWARLLKGDVRVNANRTQADLLRCQRWTLIGEVNWTCVAFDEAHRANNAKTVIDEVMLLIRPEQRIYATGTPVENSSKNLRTLLISLGCTHRTVTNANAWASATSEMTLSIDVRRIIDSYMLVLDKHFIEDRYCNLPDSLHNHARRNGLAVPTVTLPMFVDDSLNLPITHETERDAHNYVLENLQQHVPRWKRELDERQARKQLNKAVLNRKRKWSTVHDPDATGAVPTCVSRQDQAGGDVTVALSSTRVQTPAPEPKKAALSPLDAARIMRNLCFSPKYGDPAVIAKSKFLKERVVHGAVVTVLDELWTTDADGIVSCDVSIGVSDRSNVEHVVVNDTLFPESLAKRVRVMGPSAKIAHIVNYAINIPDNGKTVIFIRQYYQITLLLDAIERDPRASKALGKAFVLYGETPPNSRTSLIEEFKHSTTSRVLLANTDVAGLGVNLSFCRAVCICMPHFNPTRDKQGVDRVYRPGRPENAGSVHIAYIMLENTIEHHIMSTRTKKNGIADLLLGRCAARSRDDESTLSEAELKKKHKNFFVHTINAARPVQITPIPSDSAVYLVEESDYSGAEDECASDEVSESAHHGYSEDMFCDMSDSEADEHTTNMKFLSSIMAAPCVL